MSGNFREAWKGGLRPWPMSHTRADKIFAWIEKPAWTCLETSTSVLSIHKFTNSYPPDFPQKSSGPDNNCDNAVKHCRTTDPCVFSHFHCFKLCKVCEKYQQLHQFKKTLTEVKDFRPIVLIYFVIRCLIKKYIVFHTQCKLPTELPGCWSWNFDINAPCAQASWETQEKC